MTAGDTLYKVVFDYETDKDDELSLKSGETVRILSKEDSPDWWLAERTDGSKETGLIPSNFIQQTTPSATPASNTATANLNNGEENEARLAVVVTDYTANSSDELNLEKNRVITVLDQNVAEGWWKGDLNGKVGIFPADHVEFVENGQTHHGTTATSPNAAEPENGAKKQKKENTFKLASYGVKQGGIGSILAGGFGGLKRHSTHKRTNSNERPPSTNINKDNYSETNTTPSLPSKPHSSLSKSINQTTANTFDGSTSTSNVATRAMVLHDYSPQNDDEIQLMRGEYVTIVDEQNEAEGWWKGTNEKGATGIFPANFVEVIKDEAPPERPARARPPTVKTEQQQQQFNAIDNMAHPPPVPVGTRPTSLLTNRESLNQKRSTQNSNASLAAPAPSPRPVTTPPAPSATLPPPPRPITVSVTAAGGAASVQGTDSPPIPARRTLSVRSPPAIETSPIQSTTSLSNSGHRRIPSIPLKSPDLPPLSPGGHHPPPPNRPIPRPGSINQQQQSSDAPLVPPARKSVMSPTSEHPPSINTSMLAKPPKITPGTTPLSPTKATDSRPTSTDHLNHNNPPIPRRSMPPVPSISSGKQGETTLNGANSHGGPSRQPPSAALPSTPTQQQQQATSSIPTIANSDTDMANTMNDSGDEIDRKVRELVRLEIDKLREEFEQRLQEEIQKLRVELEDARRRG